MELKWEKAGINLFEAQTDLGLFRIIQQEGRAPLMLKVYHNSECFASAWDIKSAKTYARRKYNTLKRGVINLASGAIMLRSKGK